jgi:ATP-dependent RNA helicase RhlE
VFTRTKFGANNVAEFLTKNGIQAMALHGNKSQSARTQALAGFKSGDIRALVATDIAARGIDIEDLPHVVNYEIPNVSEDYVHRIGRTGRAGADGQAVSLVCLDEEGFMMDIERFTKQQIAVEHVEGFGPEPGEKAEPIAMGRQTIWGGAGKPPSRDVMQAAAKAARTEMMQRMREGKAAPAGRGGNQGAGGRSGERQGGAPKPAHAPHGQRHGGVNAGRGNPNPGQRPPAERRERADFGDEIPRNVDPLRTNLHNVRHDTRRPRQDASGQPDPMRTSIDSMADRGRGGRNGGGRGFGGGQNRSGGGGFGSRGSGNPPRSSGR